jgi:hypothetical protein
MMCVCVQGVFVLVKVLMGDSGAYKWVVGSVCTGDSGSAWSGTASVGQNACCRLPTCSSRDGPASAPAPHLSSSDL